MPKAVYAGSFDPPTAGHEWVIRAAEKLFDLDIVVAVADNPDKKYTFTLEERMKMLYGITDRPVVQIGKEFLVSWAQERHIPYIIRGIRSAADFEYERGMRMINHDIAPLQETVFLVPPRNLAEISSSMLKGLVGLEGWHTIAMKYARAHVVQMLEAKLQK